MDLQIGQKAPEFTVEDVHGNPITLSNFSEKKILLCFYRYAGCPFCNLNTMRLIDHYPKLSAQGLNIIAFFQSPKESLLKYVAKQNPPFPLIPDPDRTIYKKYGVKSSLVGTLRSTFMVKEYRKATRKYHFAQGTIDGDFFLMPAEFLIGPPGLTLRKVHYSTNFTDFTSFVEIEDFLAFE